MPIPAGADPGIPALDDLKKQLNRPLTDTSDDVELLYYLDAAVEVVEDFVGPLTVQTFTEQQSASSGGVIIPSKRPLVSVTSVTRDGSTTALDAALYTPDTRVGAITLNNGPTGGYTLVYEAGYATVPAAYRLAVLIIAQHLWRTQHGGGGRVMPGEDTVMVPGMSFAIPARAVELLTGGMLPGIA